MIFCLSGLIYSSLSVLENGSRENELDHYSVTVARYLTAIEAPGFFR